jgi:hypothetical protein
MSARIVIYNSGTHLRNETGVRVFVAEEDGGAPTMVLPGEEVELPYSDENETIIDVQTPVP